MIKRGSINSLHMEDLPKYTDDISPWSTSPRGRPQTTRQQRTRIKHSLSTHRLSNTLTLWRDKSNQSQLSRISKVMPVVSIDFNKQKSRRHSINPQIKKLSLNKSPPKQINPTIIRNLSILQKVFKLNRRCSFKPL